MNKKLTIENTRGLVDPCIYMLTAPNGKIYVGSSIQGFHKRSTHYRNENAHGVINSALKKYGASNFTFSILESSKAWQKDKLQKREQHHLDTLQPFGNRGYNVERVAGKVDPPKRRVSQFTRAGEPVASYESATWASVITGGSQGCITTCCKGKKPSAGGFVWIYSEEITPQEIARRVEQAADKKLERPVSQYTRAGVLVKEYESASQAARETGVDRSSITACCNGGMLSAGSYLWLYSEEITPQEIVLRVEQEENKRKKYSVSQYTRAGVLVASYTSGAQAVRDTGIHATGITNCCRGKIPSSGGYLWLYPEEITPQEIAQRVERAALVVSSSKRCVSQYTRAGVLVKEYESANQAARETVAHASNITKCCKGKKPSAGGFVWIYSEEITPQEIVLRVEQAASAQGDPTPRGVSQFTRAGVLVKEYESGAQAARETGVHAPDVTTCCKGKKPSAGGFIWKYTK